MAAKGAASAWSFTTGGEPLFGYYTSDDEWVLRRHVEMLTDAGGGFSGLRYHEPAPIRPRRSSLFKHWTSTRSRAGNGAAAAFTPNTEPGRNLELDLS